jgi:tetraacyldisaccharide 4'-kinase
MSSAPATRPLLWPVVPIYRLGLALRELQFRTGLKPIRRLRWPIVSIGNLSTGGAGKTPLTIALAKALTARGLYVDVLSRGYGRRSTLPVLVDPAGKSEDFGDEPLLIAHEAGVPVYVAAERYDAGLLAEQAAKAPQDANRSLGLKAHIMDDGFQHRQLARDVDVLLLSRRDLNDHLLPAGNLREALHAAERAHVIAVSADEPDVEAEIKKRGWKSQVWRLRRRMEIPPVNNSPGGPVAAFCGIARPEQFFQGLESAGMQLVARTAFRDHHNYTADDLSRLVSAAHKAGATALVTTEKDRVRLGALASTLPASLPLQTARLRIEIENEAAAIDWLIDHLTVPLPKRI